MPRPLPQSPAYREVVRGLLRMHKYTVDKQEESEEADGLRESMNEPWGRLTAAERDRVAGLSKDLYTITDPSTAAPEPMNPQAQHKLGEAYEARERGEWDRALELLRRWGKYVPPPLLAYLRARIWQDAGDQEVAVLFFEHASMLDPKNEAFQAMHLSALKETDNPRAREIAEKVLSESDKHIPNLVIQAADVLFGVTANISEYDAAPIYRRLIDVLTPLLTRTKDDEGLEHPSEVSMIQLLLATCHRWLGEIKQAYDYYSRALALDPWNAPARIARGIIVYGTSASAISDFEQAITSGTDIIWPYYYMAHYYLKSGRMEECRMMCERALRKPAPEHIHSELLAFLGIALTSLNYPTEAAQRAFEEAIRVDPSNDRARENLRRFQDAVALKSAKQIEWDRPSEASVRRAGQRQMRRTSSGAAGRKPALV
jgi:tetratricopeptide (TPR) repeat protein